MRDESSGTLVARVWIREPSGQVLIGERFRRHDGRIAASWLVDPETILVVMWVEAVGGDEGNSSAS
ncbi:MAG: hypothetical protein LCH61_00900 [Proteobacteria bacterium]|nr:hypothetical protein [Pseudomonadota bacterium]